ncbi:hypothetical protein L226DRAFT_393404 [Lentinus tigrinus ALCF2SS1-7]|uniref:uncharacterized protein n=1 Tax=Lentinus tigrinus ALCF2SS1-7 TaxID=1328758 RepID=UPI001165CD90|nr:hypothetical protein L226DRAFT_393404 [Lentinus tigrinus ALCF2SS1-7]
MPTASLYSPWDQRLTGSPHRRRSSRAFILGAFEKREVNSKKPFGPMGPSPKLRYTSASRHPSSKSLVSPSSIPRFGFGFVCRPFFWPHPFCLLLILILGSMRVAVEIVSNVQTTPVPVLPYLGPCPCLAYACRNRRPLVARSPKFIRSLVVGPPSLQNLRGALKAMHYNAFCC